MWLVAGLILVLLIGSVSFYLLSSRQTAHVGPGGAAVAQTPTPTPIPKPTPTPCTGSAVKIFDNWNGGGVDNGGTPPTFDTGGKTYCVTQINTYHWNGMNGAAPGTISLSGSNGTLGPWQAVGSSGQNDAPNVNWTATPPTSPPVLINGNYSCKDSDPASWSSNPTSAGQGFCNIFGIPR